MEQPENDIENKSGLSIVKSLTIIGGVTAAIIALLWGFAQLI
jgi:hypothetical protein